MVLLGEIYQIEIFLLDPKWSTFQKSSKKLSNMQGKYEYNWKEPQKSAAQPQQIHHATDTQADQCF